MNQKVQLYIENQLVDTFDSSPIKIVSSIKDFREPGKLFTDYSQNFNLPATNTNNKIFKHYYDYDIIEGGFDARKSKEARIEINDRPFREGYITLDSVDLKYNKPSTYKVTFYGNLRTLKELFNNLKLSDLDYLDDFNIKYRATGTDSFYQYLTTSKNIIDSEGTTHIQPIVVPLISNKERLYYNSSADFYGQLSDGNLYYDSNDYGTGHPANGLKFEYIRPAIRIDLIIRAIEKYVNKNSETYNISFSNDFFNSSLLQYYNLYMWLNKDKEEETSAIGRTQPIDTFTMKTEYGYVTYGGGTIQEQVFSIVCTDSNGSTSGNTGSKFIINGVEDDYVDTIEARLRCVSSDTNTKYDIKVFRDGQLLTTFNQNTQTGAQSLNFYIERDGEYRFQIVTEDNNPINFDSGFEITFVTIPTSDRHIFNNVVFTAGPIDTSDPLEFSITENMPDMSVIEFLSGIFKMFNLVCYVEGGINTTYGNYNANTTNLKNIRVKTLDSYYSSSNSELDITDRIDISSSSVHRLLPYSRIEFKYEDTEAVLAEQHKSSELEWGGEFWGIEGARAEKKYEIIPPFSHMKFERLKDENTDTVTNIQVGYSITRGSSSRDGSNINESNINDNKEEKYNPHYGKPLLFYPHRVNNGEAIPYLYESGASVINVEPAPTSYFIPLNQASVTTATTNHFGEELNEYDAYNNVESNQSNLFNLYYKNYITHLFDSRSRITKVKANLTNAFLSKFSLADKIRISGKTYTINKANIDIVSGKADFELQRYYSIKSYYCLPADIDVNIEVTSAGNQYVFDNKYGTYQIDEGTYTFEDVPSGHPIAFHNFGKENNITYTGETNAGSKVGLDGNTYTYYSGNVTVTVTGDFGTISYECYNHGYMGGENNLAYNSACSEDGGGGVTPTPTDITADSTNFTADNALITADQTSSDVTPTPTPTPTPEVGDFTVDTINTTSDDTNITSDKLDQ